MRKTVSKKKKKVIQKKAKSKIKPNTPVVPARPVGRPSSYTQEIADQICFRLIHGEGLKQILKDDGMPNLLTVYNWIRTIPEFLNQYTQARDEQADTFADEIVTISDDGTNDFMEKETQSGRVMIVADHEHINRSRIRVDARKWVAERMKPKKYGVHAEGTQVNVNVTTHTTVDFSKMSAEEITDMLLGRKNGREFIPRETSQSRADTA